MSRLDKKYKLEEKHRGKWQPLIKDGSDTEQKTAILEPRFADSLNMHADLKAIRYVLIEEKKPVKKGNPMQKAKALVEAIRLMETVAEIDAAIEGSTAKSVIKAANERKTELK